MLLSSRCFMSTATTTLMSTNWAVSTKLTKYSGDTNRRPLRQPRSSCAQSRSVSCAGGRRSGPRASGPRPRLCPPRPPPRPAQAGRGRRQGPRGLMGSKRWARGAVTEAPAPGYGPEVPSSPGRSCVPWCPRTDLSTTQRLGVDREPILASSVPALLSPVQWGAGQAGSGGALTSPRPRSPD